jgi:hypothetical protein
MRSKLAISALVIAALRSDGDRIGADAAVSRRVKRRQRRTGRH